MSEHASSPIPVFTPTTVYSPFGVKAPQADTPYTSHPSETQVNPGFDDSFDPTTNTTTVPSNNTSTPSIHSSTLSFTPYATSTALTQPDLPLSDDGSAATNKGIALIVNGKELTRAQHIARRHCLAVNTLLANGKADTRRYAKVSNQCQSDLHIKPGPYTHPKDWAAELNNRLRPPFPVDQVWLRSSCSKSNECRHWLVQHGKISRQDARAMRKTWEALLDLPEATSSMDMMFFEQTGTVESGMSKKEKKKLEKERKMQEKEWKMQEKEKKRQEEREAKVRGEKKSLGSKLSHALDVFYS